MYCPVWPPAPQLKKTSGSLPLAISSAKYHDYNLLMLMVLFTGAMVIISSLLAQSINEAIDPRIKSGEVVC